MRIDVLSVAITGFKVPEPTLQTMDKFIEFNESRKPIFMAWGIVALFGDAAICVSCEYRLGPGPKTWDRRTDNRSQVLLYLFKSKDSILHHGKTLYHKFKALIVETM